MSAGNGSSLGYFLAGLGLGSAVALLLTPKSGKEAREYLAGKAEEGREYVRAKTEGLRRQGERLAEVGRDCVNAKSENLRHQPEGAIEEVKI
jgi:gas vesicle protein